jgi:anti-anti-sigma regulatory factor/HAMP domain-containing protein
MVRLKLRTRLIVLTIGGALMLTAITTGGTLWSYRQLRAEVTNDTRRTLEAQTAGYIQETARDTTNETTAKLEIVQGLVTAAHDYLLETALEPSLAIDDFRESPDGWRFRGKETATLVAPTGSTTQQLADIQIAHGLDALLPSLAGASAEIDRISFLSATSVVKTFPFVTPDELRPGWKVTIDPAYVAVTPEVNPLREPVWVPLHDSIRGDAQVVSVAVPVYFGDTFRGAILADISLSRLARYLGSIGGGDLSFSALIDDSGRVLATTLLGQQQLIGYDLGDDARAPFRMSDAARESLGPALAGIVSRQLGSAVARLGDHDYILAYEGIDLLGWSLLIATPRDNAIIAAQSMAERVDSIVGRAQGITLGVIALALLLLVGTASLGVRQWLSRPLDRLIHATNSVASGDLRPITLRGSQEIEQLAGSFNHMVGALNRSHQEIVNANHQLEQTVEQRTRDLQLAVSRLEEASQQQQQLIQALRDVSTPILPVIRGVLVVPLIGQLDEQRLDMVTAALLDRIQRSSVRIALLDITGAPLIDTAAAKAILQLVQAARLLGCEIRLVGIAPEVAQTLVTLGIDLSGIHTAVDLQSGVEQITRQRRAAS